MLVQSIIEDFKFKSSISGTRHFISSHFNSFIDYILNVLGPIRDCILYILSLKKDGYIVGTSDLILQYFSDPDEWIISFDIAGINELFVDNCYYLSKNDISDFLTKYS